MSNIEKHYRTGNETVQALKSISIAIEEGEFLAMMGPSGSGKSTLLTVLGALNRPTKGKLIVDGIDVYDLNLEQQADFRSEYLGFVFQSFHLISYLTVLENVMLPLVVTEGSRSQKRTSALEVIEKVGLTAKRSRLPGELSGGEQQRVAVARALVNRPPLILADEPTGNLDTKTSMEIVGLLKKFNEEGHTCLMVTHNLDNLRFASRALYLQDGRIDERPQTDSAA